MEQSEKLLAKLLLGLIFLILVFSCRNEIDCTNTSSNISKSVFVDSVSGEIISLTFDSILILDFTDTILYDTVNVSDTIELPLNPFSAESEFLFFSRESDTIPIVDTLRLGYETRQRLISEECGATQSFIQLDTLFHTFDSVFIQSSNVNTLNEINLRIVF
jgi:hypothetical protein